MQFLTELIAIIDQRLSQPAHRASYVARLDQKGINAMVQKCGEEACEVVIAAKDYAQNPQDATLRGLLVNESADLLFHHLIVLRKLGLSFDEVIDELENRARKGEASRRADVSTQVRQKTDSKQH